jgi:hypothetical protein
MALLVTGQETPKQIYRFKTKIYKPLSLVSRRATAEPKQYSQRPVIGWVTKIYYLQLPRAPSDRTPSADRGAVEILYNKI